jgi:hypothetical protein
MPTHVRESLRRLEAFQWWRAVMIQYPGGVVPVATAARLSGKSRRRIWELMATGRLPRVSGMPGGGSRDVFVPVDWLLTAPLKANRGQPGQFGPLNRQVSEQVRAAAIERRKQRRRLEEWMQRVVRSRVRPQTGVSGLPVVDNSESAANEVQTDPGGPVTVT